MPSSSPLLLVTADLRAGTVTLAGDDATIRGLAPRLGATLLVTDPDAKPLDAVAHTERRACVLHALDVLEGLGLNDCRVEVEKSWDGTFRATAHIGDRDTLTAHLAGREVTVYRSAGGWFYVETIIDGVAIHASWPDPGVQFPLTPWIVGTPFAVAPPADTLASVATEPAAVVTNAVDL